MICFRELRLKILTVKGGLRFYVALRVHKYRINCNLSE